MRQTNAKTSVYTGSKGGGKSIFAINDALPFLASGATVYVNFKLYFEPLKALVIKLHGVEIEEDQIVRLPEDFNNFRDHLKKGLNGQHNLLILDEAHLDYSNEDQRQQASKRADDQRFISHARKSKIEVFFISQNFKNLDVKFRRQTQVHIYHFSLDDMPILGEMFYYLWGQRHRRTYCNVLEGEIVRPSVDSKWKKRPKAIYDVYDTDEMFGYDLETSERRELKKIEKKGLSKKMKLILLQEII